MRRVAVVTGAARGIGAATVRAFVSRGWAVVAVDRGCDDPRLPYRMGSYEELHAVANDGGTKLVTSAIADVSDPQALGEVIEATERQHGGIDAIVSVAGVIAGGVPHWELPLEQQEAVLGVNLGGALACARVGIPALLRRPVPRDGRFIAVASTAASRGLPLLAAYCAAKAGIVGFTRALALELAGTGITVNTVSPGSTRTPILDESARLYGLGCADDFTAQQPIARLLHPEDVAGLIVWLAGPEGAAVTGVDMPIDGGLSL